MQIKYYEIDEIKPYKNNPRINQHAVREVAESIKQFGFKVPIIIDKNKEIVCDHTRYGASILLGLDKIPCIMASDLNEEQIKAFRLADNKVSELSKWDEDKLREELSKIKNVNVELLGFIKEDNSINWDDIEEINEDNYEEPEHKMMECPFCNHLDRADKFKKNKILNVVDVI